MRNRRVDAELGRVALDTKIVISAVFLRSGTKRSPLPTGREAGVRAGASQPRCCFILWAVCQQRSVISPTRPIAWLSELNMLMAPRSCSRTRSPTAGPKISA